MPTDLLATSEVAAIFDLHPSTLSRWVKDGTIVPAHRLPGKTGAMLFTPSEVERLKADLIALHEAAISSLLAASAPTEGVAS